jgi:hypothetical protein
MAGTLVGVAYADTISADGDTLAGTNNVVYGSAAFQNACSSRGTPVNGAITIKFNGTVHYDPGATVTVSVVPDASAAGAGITATGGSAQVPAAWDTKGQVFTVPITTTVPSTVADGSYTVNVEAVGAAHDGQGHAVQLAADDSYAVSVTCTGGNSAPIINWNAHPPLAGDGDTRTFTFGIKDTDSSLWEFAAGYPDCGPNGTLSGTPSIDSAGKQGSFDCTFSGSSGSSTVRAKVTDGTSGSNELTQRVSLGTATAPPVVDAGPPASGAEGSAIPLSGSVTDPDTPFPAISWSYAPFSGVDLGATCSFADPSSPATTITCTDDGVYTATLTADDGSNPPVSDSATVTVTNATPAVMITAPTAGSSYQPGTPVSLSASFTDAGHNDTHTCTIDWGDGSPADTGTVTESNGSGTCDGSHTYSASGSQTITVSVIDDDGATGQAMVDIVVSSARSLKQDALARTNALIPGAGKPDSDKLKQAAKEITTSLDPTRWGADDNHVSQMKGQEVFDHEKNAARRLMDLLKPPPPPPPHPPAPPTIPASSIQPIIDDLVNADVLLAQTEIADAVAAHGNAMKINQARDELTKAADERSKGHFDAAIDHYKHAWEHARDAEKGRP